jgi:hypothetical protein
MRGSPSLVGRGIANPMSVRTRGFESHSPRLQRSTLRLNKPNLEFYALMVRRKTVKPRTSGPKNITTGLCPKCGTIGKILIVGVIGSEKGKCQACNGEFDL